MTNACTIGASNMAFGDYNPTALVPVSGTSTLQVTCTLGSTASIALDQGLAPGSGSTAAAPARRLQAGTSRLGYDLYQDATHLLTWGAGSSSLAYVGLGVATNVTVYGGIAASQVVSAGDFSDTVTATVNF